MEKHKIIKFALKNGLEDRHLKNYLKVFGYKYDKKEVENIGGLNRNGKN